MGDFGPAEGPPRAYQRFVSSSERVGEIAPDTVPFTGDLLNHTQVVTAGHRERAADGAQVCGMHFVRTVPDGSGTGI